MTLFTTAAAGVYHSDLFETKMISINKSFILIADDDPDDRDMLKAVLLAKDPLATIDMVDDGYDVLELLSTIPDGNLPSVLVLDFKMTKLNADQVLLKLKSEHRYDGIVKIVWSTSTRSDHKEACMSHGASEYITKPNSRSELEAIGNLVFEHCH